MADSVPKLAPRPLSRSIRLLSLVLPGVRTVAGQIEPYTRFWDEQNQLAAAATGPLLVAVGDSTAIGIGATGPERSYVGLLHRRLRIHQAGLDQSDQHQDHRGGDQPWRVVNLALSGARVRDALDRQLPIMAGLAPDLVVCCIGTNDLVWGKETTALRTQLRQLITALPEGTLIGSLAGGSARARMANRALRNAGAERGLRVLDPWSEATPTGHERLAPDRFHPNDLGYELMAVPFYRALGLSDHLEIPPASVGPEIPVSEPDEQ